MYEMHLATCKHVNKVECAVKHAMLNIYNGFSQLPEKKPQHTFKTQ